MKKVRKLLSGNEAIALAAYHAGVLVATAYPGTKMFSRPDVMEKLSKAFGLSFDANKKPVCDEKLREYILGLGDATRVLADADSNPLNYGDMDNQTFLRARGYIDNGNLEKILDM